MIPAARDDCKGRELGSAWVRWRCPLAGLSRELGGDNWIGSHESIEPYDTPKRSVNAPILVRAARVSKRPLNPQAPTRSQS